MLYDILFKSLKIWHSGIMNPEINGMLLKINNSIEKADFILQLS